MRAKNQYFHNVPVCVVLHDVFDEDHFINALANGVKVMTKLPKEIDSSMKKLKYFKSWSGMDCYQEGDSKHLG
ncbi:hypothetical protein Peur_033658 [Populus x canadensis]